MISALLPYTKIAELLAFLAMVAGLIYGGHEFLQHEQNIGYQRAQAEYTEKALVAEKAAREKEQALTLQLQKAENEAIQRDQVIRSTANAAAVASSSLHDTINSIRGGVSSANADALRQSVSSLSSVLDRCQDNYRGMAERADRHASDEQKLIDAWPK